MTAKSKKLTGERTAEVIEAEISELEKDMSEITDSRFRAMMGDADTYVPSMDRYWELETKVQNLRDELASKRG